MAKTVQLIFVKSNGIGLLLEDANLESYNRLHQKAVEAYKKKMGIVDKISGKMIKCQFQPINKQNLSGNELEAPTDQIIMVQDNGTFIRLQGESFINYQEQHFQGLQILGLPQQIKGRLIKIST